MVRSKYRTSFKEIDEAIDAYLADDMKGRAQTRYLVRHSKKPKIVASLKPVMWPKGHGHASYKTDADGGEAHKAILALNYIEEDLAVDAFDEEPELRAALMTIGLSKAPSKLTVFRYVHGKDLAAALMGFVEAEQRLRKVLGRPHERRDVLRATGEFLYCRLFGGVQCEDPNKYGYDVDRTSMPKKVQVKVARKAATNNAGMWIRREHLEGEGAFDALALFWLSPQSCVIDYVELSIRELQEIAKGPKNKFGFDLKPAHVGDKIRTRSFKRFRDACAEKSLGSLDRTSPTRDR
jgi:hypothetical protein